MTYIGDKIIPVPLHRRFFPAVMGGKKTSTIRLPDGVSAISNGSYIRFRAAKREELSCVVRVKSVRRTRFGQLGSAEVATEAMKDLQELRSTLEEFYGPLAADREVVVVEYDPPIDGEIRLTYTGVVAGASKSAAAEAIADIGWGSWTDDFKGVWELLGITSDELNRRAGVRYGTTDHEQQTGTVQVRIPASNIDWSYNSIPGLLSTIAGSVLGSSYFRGARITRVELPSSVEAQFYGPRLGIDGIRRICKVTDRPLLAFTVKPRLGLTPSEFARVCVEVASGGIDIVEDDERQSNQAWSDVVTRARVTLDALAKTNAVYSANITGRADQIVAMAEELIESGVKLLKIDVLPAGFSALQAVSEHLHRKNLDVGITVFPAMNAVYDRVGRGLILQLARLCGADVIYAGIPAFEGKGTPRIQDEVGFSTAASNHEILKTPKQFQRTVLPTVSTGINPMNVGAYTQLLGKNVGFFVGAGIAANPLGLREGARLMLRALEKATEDRAEDIFTNNELEGFGELFGNFVRYAEQEDGVKRAASMVRAL